MDQPILSIVIPTHNRAKYASSSISSILNEVKGSFELIVHDTSDNNILLDFVKTIKDERLRYFKINEPLSMTENHNRAFAKSTGKYLCLIGDDDVVTVDIVQICEWAEKNNIRILNHKIGASYVWPDFLSLRMGNRHSSRIYIDKNISNKVEIFYSNIELKKAFNRAFQGAENLPKIYHGIVRADVFKEIKEITGEYFFGASPDISAAILLAYTCEQYVIINYPFSIPGASGGSNTGRSAVGKHKGELSTDPHTKRFKNLVWPEEVPLFFSVETVWLQAAVETFKVISPKDIRKINFLHFYALCFIKHMDYFDKIKEKVSLYASREGVTTYFILFGNIIQTFMSKVLLLAKRLTKPTAAGGKDYIENILNLEGVPTLIEKDLIKKGIFFDYERKIK